MYSTIICTCDGKGLKCPVRYKVCEIFKMLSPTQFDQYHIWHPYQQSPSVYPHHLVKSAEGVWLYLENGQAVIDGMSSWWSAIHGYNHPVLNQAIKNQLDKMAHVMFGGLTHQPAVDLAQKLTKLVPAKLSQVFFSDSGSVAVEVALKMALQFYQAQGRLAKNKFMTPLGGYHGDTFLAMSVCDPQNGMHHLFSTVLPQQIFIKQPNQPGAIADLTQKLKHHHQDIAALILEPMVQGSGGMYFYEADYLKAVRALCTKYDVLLIVDEIASGFGRTGKFFACEWAGVSADILCLGKALTGGYLSLGATLTSSDIAVQIGVLMHGPTFMANPLACSVAGTSIDLLLHSDWQDNIRRIQTHFERELLPLKTHKKVADVRVFGAIAVVEMHDNIDVETTQNQLLGHGVWLRPFAKLLYSMPSFIISDKELVQLSGAIKRVVLS